MPEINCCTLTGQLVSIGRKQYSPAGVLRCRLWLEHRSRQLENDHPVEVTARLAVQLVGNKWADTLNQLKSGMHIEVEGFLAAGGPGKHSRDRIQLQASRLEYR